MSLSVMFILQHGLIATTNGYLFIEPVMSNDVINTKSKGRQQHVVYKNTKSTNHDNGGCLSPGNCGSGNKTDNLST